MRPRAGGLQPRESHHLRLPDTGALRSGAAESLPSSSSLEDEENDEIEKMKKFIEEQKEETEENVEESSEITSETISSCGDYDDNDTSSSVQFEEAEPIYDNDSDN